MSCAIIFYADFRNLLGLMFEPLLALAFASHGMSHNYSNLCFSTFSFSQFLHSYRFDFSGSWMLQIAPSSIPPRTADDDKSWVGKHLHPAQMPCPLLDYPQTFTL